MRPKAPFGGLPYFGGGDGGWQSAEEPVWTGLPGDTPKAATLRGRGLESDTVRTA
ncbi:MAG: hypothetical protein BWX88_00667 [Planctomycetes bacterium ADurb.Bin126]|nr:MAG: hypothetical protein BWX88_00667 [Planctomycetes bacterium ADurb.Bin126]